MIFDLDCFRFFLTFSYIKLSWQSKLPYMIRKEIHNLKFRIKVEQILTVDKCTDNF